MKTFIAIIECNEGATVETLRTALENKWFKVLDVKEEKPRIHIVGRRWFQKTHGNTYHTAQIVIDGQTVHKTGRCYGYGQQYMQTAFAWLQEKGYIPQRAAYGWQTFQDYGVTDEVHDVALRSDL